MAKKATVQDIAKFAGVSSATVSRVINHPELVKAQTVKAVEDAMNALGADFTKSSADSAYSRNIIVLNVQDIKNTFYQQIMDGANISAKSHGYDLMITQSSLKKDRIPDFIKLLKKVDAKGVILLSILPMQSLEAIANEFPVVQCSEYNPESNLPYVSINNYESAKLATEYLIASGRNKIAFVNGPLSYQYAVERRRGYMDAMNSAGLTVRPDWCIQLPKVDFDMAYTSVRKMLDAKILPNAIFAVSDILAAAAVKAVKQSDLLVPEDISVVGFDNSPISIMTSPSITTVSQPAYQLGFCACDMIHDIVLNSYLDSKTIMLNTEFIIRESTQLQLRKNRQ